MALPIAQPYPASRIRIGAVLYVASADTDDDRKTVTEIQEWVVRSIRAKRGSKSRFGVAIAYAENAVQYVNLTLKMEYVTWGKRSKKAGDYGWLKSIPRWAVKQFPVGGELPQGVYTTPRAALSFAVASAVDRIARFKTYLAEESDQTEIEELKREIDDQEAQLMALKRRLSKLASK